MTDDESPEEVTAAAIARRLGVGRAAVTNWRRRYADFPAPKTAGSSPRFAWADVERWLVATGKGDQLAVFGRTDTGTQVLDSADPLQIAPPAPGGIGVAGLAPDSVVARAMVALLPALDADHERLPAVLDPVCGPGERLLAAAERYGDGVTLRGRDVDEGAIETARYALRLHPLAGECDIEVGPPSGRADAVVCVPDATAPVGVVDGRRTADAVEIAFAWVRRCVELLRPRGVAVVAVSALAGARSSGGDVRAELVRTGALRAVVALPPLPGVPDRCLWVLRQAPGGHDDVHMIDLSGLAAPADLPLRVWEEWHRERGDAAPGTARHVPRMSLLDGTTDLTPSRHVAAWPGSTAAGLAELTTRLRTLYGQVGALFPAPVPSSSDASWGLGTFAELERNGALSIMARDASPHGRDVVLRTGGRTPVVVDDDAQEPTGIAQVLEIDTERLDPYFVALFLRPEVEAVPVASTHGGISRDDLRRCRIPRFSLAEQRRYGEAYRHVLVFQELATALADVAGSVLDQTLHGLTTGALLPAGPAPAFRIEGEIA